MTITQLRKLKGTQKSYKINTSSLQAKQFLKQFWLVMLDVWGFESRQGLGTFLLAPVSRSSLDHTQPPIQYIQGSLCLEVKRPERDTDHSLPSSAVKNA